ncbi:14724_t:CDS:2 [Gigaspora rosea]|nr:14724_t:CDS:2 [Gigaspora rosea]
MGIYKSYKRRYQARQAAQKSLEKRQTISCNKTIAEIQALLLDLNQEQLDDIYKRLIELSRNEIINNEEQEKA